MGISALAVDQFPEYPLADHSEDRHVVSRIAIILQEHAGNPGFLVGLHQFPALFDGIGRADFDSRIDSGLHGIDGHGDVQLPGGGDDDTVEIVALQQREVGSLILAVPVGSRVARLLDPVLSSTQVIGGDVANRGYAHVGKPQTQPQELRSPASDANEAEADLSVIGAFQDGGRQTESKAGSGHPLEKTSAVRWRGALVQSVHLVPPGATEPSSPRQGRQSVEKVVTAFHRTWIPAERIASRSHMVEYGPSPHFFPRARPRFRSTPGPHQGLREERKWLEDRQPSHFCSVQYSRWPNRLRAWPPYLTEGGSPREQSCDSRITGSCSTASNKGIPLVELLSCTGRERWNSSFSGRRKTAGARRHS